MMGRSRFGWNLGKRFNSRVLSRSRVISNVFCKEPIQASPSSAALHFPYYFPPVPSAQIQPGLSSTCVLGEYILPVSRAIKRSPHSTSTKWANRIASSLLNRSQNSWAVPSVSYPNRPPLLSSIRFTILQLRNKSFRNSKGTPEIYTVHLTGAMLQSQRLHQTLSLRPTRQGWVQADVSEPLIQRPRRILRPIIRCLRRGQERHS